MLKDSLSHVGYQHMAAKTFWSHPHTLKAEQCLTTFRWWAGFSSFLISHFRSGSRIAPTRGRRVWQVSPIDFCVNLTCQNQILEPDQSSRVSGATTVPVTFAKIIRPLDRATEIITENFQNDPPNISCVMSFFALTLGLWGVVFLLT